MNMAMMTATQSTTTASSATKGFMSFSSQSILDSGKGPTIVERLRTNCNTLAINMQRYKFPHAVANAATMIRLLQCYCVLFMPAYSDFWLATSESKIFVTILKIPTHLCFFSATPVYHAILVLIFCLFFVFTALWTFLCILPNPSESSHSNGVIFVTRLLNEFFVPIIGCFTFSATGFLFGQPIFHGNTDGIIILGMIFGAVTLVIATLMHFWSFYLIRGAANIEYDRLFVPWGSNVKKYAILEYIFYIITFVEEFLPLNKMWWRIGYSIAVCLLCNPVLGVLITKIPLFQDPHDTVYFGTMFIVGFIGTILINVEHYTPIITPTIVFVICVIVFVLVQLLLKELKASAMGKLLKRLYSVYKSSKPVLPHVTPLVFTAPLSSQVALSQEAYQVMQAFNSLEITTPGEFHRFLSIGSMSRMPAITNIDFIKWGLNYFTDETTLIMCAQICQHYGESSQTQTVLLAKVREDQKMNLYMQQIVTSLEYSHTDAISDKPLFLKALEKKALGGLTRCRRCLALFWGCILHHSPSGMSEALCRIRDTVKETDAHFDELMRCYPTSLSAISHYLAYMIEIKGEYIESNHYINDMSAKFIEMKSDQIEDEESMDGMSVLLADQNKSFAPYIRCLGTYMEQQRHVLGPMKAPLKVLVGLTIVSLILILGSLVYVIASTLTGLNAYPRLVKIASTFGEAVMELAELTMASRRLCLFAAGVMTDGSVAEHMGVTLSPLAFKKDTLKLLVEKSEILDSLLKSFYTATAEDDTLLKALYSQSYPMEVYGKEVDVTLAFALEFIALNLKQLAGNVPFEFINVPLKESRTIITNSVDTERNAESFAKLFREKTLESMQNINFRYADGSHHNFTNHFKEIHAKILSNEIDLEDVNIEDYAVTCNSSEMRNVIKNNDALLKLTSMFMNAFYAETDRMVDSLAETLYWSMIIFPVVFIVAFGAALIFCSLYIRHESNFRMTLFLSLPEQVASEIFRSGGGHTSKKKSQGRAQEKDELCTVPEDGVPLKSTYGGMMPSSIQETEAAKEKAMSIETLHQYASTGSRIQGTGLIVYIIWMSIYFLIAALTVFGLCFYAREVNDTFHGRSKMVAYAAMRFCLFNYNCVTTEELFYYEDSVRHLNMWFTDFEDAFLTAEHFLDAGEMTNNALTFGTEPINFDFREYQSIKDMYLRSVIIEIPDFNTLTITNSVAGMVHDGFKSLGMQGLMEIYCTVTRALINGFKKVYNDRTGIPFAVNDATWRSFTHLLVGHLNTDLQTAMVATTNGVHDTINESFVIACAISVTSLVCVVLIFVGPVQLAVRAVQGYVKMMMHTLCEVPPDVFSRSMYIHKWLKGQITRRNYRNKNNETYYSRRVSANLQNAVLKESPEKLVLFNTQGEFVEAPSIVPANIEEPDLETVLSYIMDVQNGKHSVESIQHAMDKFMEAKDTRDNIIINVTSLEGRPLSLTITGITSSDASLSTTSSMQKFYAYIAILIHDITQESCEETQYETQKAHTLALLSCIVPQNFAQRMHDGERRISFTAGIGSVLTAAVVDYNKKFSEADPKQLIAAIQEIRSICDNLLTQFTNVSMMSMKDGVMTFVAGLFNDEQNGRTEAIDTIQFAGQLHKSLTEILEKNGVSFDMQYGLCTGGPIYCKLLMDSTPVVLVAGETVTASELLVDKCAPGCLVLERTTYECIYGMNIDAQMAGETDICGRKVSYYSVPMKNIAPQV